MNDALLLQFLEGNDAPCPRCGYNLHALPGTRCPECGIRLRLTVGVTEPYTGFWIGAVMAITLPAGIGMLMWIMVLQNGTRALLLGRGVFHHTSIVLSLGGPAVALLLLIGRRLFLKLDRRVQLGLMLLAMLYLLLTFGGMVIAGLL